MLASLLQQDLSFLFVANHKGSLFGFNMLEDGLLLSDLVSVAKGLVASVFLVLLHIGNDVVHFATT